MAKSRLGSSRRVAAQRAVARPEAGRSPEGRRPIRAKQKGLQHLEVWGVDMWIFVHMIVEKARWEMESVLRFKWYHPRHIVGNMDLMRLDSQWPSLWLSACADTEAVLWAPNCPVPWKRYQFNHAFQDIWCNSRSCLVWLELDWTWVRHSKLDHSWIDIEDYHSLYTQICKALMWVHVLLRSTKVIDCLGTN